MIDKDLYLDRLGFWAEMAKDWAVSARIYGPCGELKDSPNAPGALKDRIRRARKALEKAAEALRVLEGGDL